MLRLEEVMYTIKEVAPYLKVSERTVQRLINDDTWRQLDLF